MIRLLCSFTLLGTLAVAAVQSSTAEEKKAGNPPYVHAVIFYLKKDAPKDSVKDAIADCHKLLAKVPSVRNIWAGRPAKKSTPKFAKTDYDFGLLVLFDDFDGLNKYLVHPLHLKYVDKYSKLFDEVHVYDFTNQKK